jgi:hypothetical protein
MKHRLPSTTVVLAFGILAIAGLAGLTSSGRLLAMSRDDRGAGVSGAPESVPGEVVFAIAETSYRSPEFRPGLGPRGRTGLPALDAELASLGARSVASVFDLRVEPASKRAHGMDRIFLARYGAGLAADEAAGRLARLPEIEWAEPNHLYRVMLSPDDPLYPSQWAHDNTGQAVAYGGGLVGTPDADTDTDEAWEWQTGSPAITIAVVDTGVDTGHPEFAGRVLPGWGFVNGDADPSDDHGHGTSCAGIALAAGDNAQGVAGVAWGVKLLPVKVFAFDGFGVETDIVNGITWAADNGVRIQNLSFGGPNSVALQTAVNYAVETRGNALFCASGNDGFAQITYPAYYINCTAVGALSPCNERKSFTSCDGETFWGSNYGVGLAFLAPGVRIHTTEIRGAAGFGPGDYVSDFNGTSSATPHAAGIGALVWSQNPSLTQAQVRSALQSTCDNLGPAGWDAETGYGRLNARRAVQSAGGGGGPVVLFSEGFETGAVPGSVWSAGDNDGGSGADYWGDQTASSGARVHGGSSSAYCADNASPAGQAYDNRMDAHMTLANPIGVAGYTNLTLSFWKWHKTFDAGDYLSFQEWKGSAWAERLRWYGNSAVWQQISYTLAGFTSYRFRFVFVSNASKTSEGAYIDDILLTGLP